MPIDERLRPPDSYGDTPAHAVAHRFDADGEASFKVPVTMIVQAKYATDPGEIEFWEVSVGSAFR